jgi:NitT/TauT family transport system substrate-binding protein
MTKFRIQPHARLQEWVAEEHGYFKEQGLDYEFTHSYATSMLTSSTVQSTESAPPEIKQGAFEDMEAGRTCDISAACHWAVSMASTTQHGQMWGHAYSVTPSAIFVPPESPVRRPEDLAGVPVGVGYHSGSHFSALQGLEPVLAPEQIQFNYAGLPQDRLLALLDRKVQAANVFGIPYYVLEQQGFRKVLDTSFMIGFLFGNEAEIADIERYFRALQQAQRDIDLQLERYRHYYLKELQPRFHDLVDVRIFGPGERIVFEPYTREMYEQTHRWMQRWNLFDNAQSTEPNYELAVRI